MFALSEDSAAFCLLPMTPFCACSPLLLSFLGLAPLGRAFFDTALPVTSTRITDRATNPLSLAVCTLTSVCLSRMALSTTSNIHKMHIDTASHLSLPPAPPCDLFAFCNSDIPCEVTGISILKPSFLGMAIQSSIRLTQSQASVSRRDLQCRTQASTSTAFPQSKPCP